jgi:hypothetical protein
LRDNITFEFIKGTGTYTYTYGNHYKAFINCKKCKHNILVDELIYHVICNAPIIYGRHTTYWKHETEGWECKTRILKE